MGFFRRMFSGISKVASSVAEAVSSAVNKFADAVKSTTSWISNKLSKSHYDARSIESRKGVEQTLSEFRNGIERQATKAEETSIYSAMSRFDDLASVLDGSFPELVELVRKRQQETENLLSHTIINYVQEHVSENDQNFRKILEMDPCNEKQKKLSARMHNIINDAQELFGNKLKEQIKLLNDELNIRLNQKINAQEAVLNDTKKKYHLLFEQQTNEMLDIQKIEEECLPVAEVSSYIEGILIQEEKK